MAAKFKPKPTHSHLKNDRPQRTTWKHRQTQRSPRSRSRQHECKNSVLLLARRKERLDPRRASSKTFLLDSPATQPSHRPPRTPRPRRMATNPQVASGLQSGDLKHNSLIMNAPFTNYGSEGLRFDSSWLHSPSSLKVASLCRFPSVALRRLLLVGFLRACNACAICFVFRVEVVSKVVSLL